MSGAEWQTEDRVQHYLGRADDFPHRAEGEVVVRELVPPGARRILDLGTGDGRMLALLGEGRPEMEGIGLDFSEPMMAAARERFAGDERITLVEHDLNQPLPGFDDGAVGDPPAPGAAAPGFDAIISSFVIHHLEDERKRSLYGEIHDLLRPGGLFLNMEHVASATPRLHEEFFAAIGESLEDEDRSDKLLDVETQLGWLRALGFNDVDCLWKYREMALLAATKAG